MTHKSYKTILIVLSTILCILFFSLRVLQFRSFFSFEWEDDARVNQVAYNISQSFYPYQTIIQKSPEGPAFLNEHFSPLYFLLALFYKAVPHIFTWYFLVTLLTGFSSLFLYLTARQILEEDRPAYLIALAFLVYPPLHYVTLGAMDPRNFALPLLILMFYFQQSRKFIPYIIFMVLSCFCLEDIPVYVFLFGLYLYLTKSPKRWWMSTLVFSGLYFFGAVTIMDSINQLGGTRPGADAFTETYNYINADMVQHFLTAAQTDPGRLLGTVFTWSKMRFFVMILYPLLFLPLLSPETYIGLTVMLFEIGLPEGFFNENSYYAGILIPFVFLGLIHGLKRFQNRFGVQRTTVVCVIIIVMSLVGGLSRNIIGEAAWEDGVWPVQYNNECDKRFMDVRNIFDRRLYRQDSDDVIAWKMLKMIPADASVTVTGDLLPAVSSRREVYEFAYTHPDAVDGMPHLANYPDYKADYMLINSACLINGMGNGYVRLEDKYLRKEISRMVNKFDYHVVHKEGNFVLLEKGDREEIIDE